MGVVASTLGLGAEMTIEEEGPLKGSYTFSPWTLEIQGLFERYLEKNAVETVKQQEHYLSTSQFDAQMKQVLRDVALGVFTFGTDAVSQALESPKHVAYLVFLMLKKAQPDMTRDRASELVRNHYPDVLKAINLANTDPNRKREEKAASSSPKA